MYECDQFGRPIKGGRGTGRLCWLTLFVSLPLLYLGATTGIHAAIARRSDSSNIKTNDYEHKDTLCNKDGVKDRPRTNCRLAGFDNSSFWDWARQQSGSAFNTFVAASNRVEKCQTEIARERDDKHMQLLRERLTKEKKTMEKALEEMMEQYAYEQFSHLRTLIKDNRKEQERYEEIEALIEAVARQSASILEETKNSLKGGEK